MNKLSRKILTRDEIIFPDGYQSKKYFGGVRHFNDLSLKSLERLVKENFIDLEERQNEAPSVGEIPEFMRKYPDYIALGYTVDVTRDDYRVSLEGVSKKSRADSEEEFEDFMALFKYADEIDTDWICCWFD